VDTAGSRSGPSDYTASPRPVIVSAPVTRARNGAEYHYRVAAIHSLGDLRMRVVGGKETMNFWDVERLRFDIQRGPRWLTIDRATGLLSGTPDRSGTTEVAVSVTLERDVRRLDEEALKWGIEKVNSSGMDTVGSATQNFVIEVGL
jgi:Putative Ig domain